MSDVPIQIWIKIVVGPPVLLIQQIKILVLGLTDGLLPIRSDQTNSTAMDGHLTCRSPLTNPRISGQHGEERMGGKAHWRTHRCCWAFISLDREGHVVVTRHLCDVTMRATRERGGAAWRATVLRLLYMKIHKWLYHKYWIQSCNGKCFIM
jgi:hypothetical protein